MRIFHRSLSLLLVSFGLVASALVFVPEAALAVGGEGEGWPSFNESDGCGSPWIRGPKVEESGSLDLTSESSTLIRGPVGDYFGRTARDIYFSRFGWDVPMSDHETLTVHDRMAPAIDALDINLAAAIDGGLNYNIYSRYSSSYNNRTVGGRYRVSQHGVANALDINSHTNPYNRWNILNTNMPAWFVDAWSDAGFCWGGNWIEVKDPMHFNWRGPLFTPGVTELEPSVSPLTTAEDFTRTMHSVSVPGPLNRTTARLLMDADSDGAPDIVNISDSGTAQIIDVMSASEGFNGCAVTRYISPQDSAGDTVIHGDWNRDGAQDIWIIDDSDGIEVTAILRYGDFRNSDSRSISTTAGDAYLAADHNVDGWTDLYVLRHDGSTWSVDVFSGEDDFTSLLITGSVTGPSDLRFTAIDRDLDQVPDLVGIGSTGSLIANGASGYIDIEDIPGFPGSFDDIAGTDFDGDGRHDLAMLTEGSLRVHAGNSALSGVAVTSWFEWPTFACDEPEVSYPYEGWFLDDDDSIHRYDIDEIALTDITRGCNPPTNDNYCPDDSITRGELAAFLRRALDLPDADDDADTFADDDVSIFVGDIESLVAAGINVPCDGDGLMFCPDEVVARDVMAQFLVAAFGYPPSDVDPFVDDEESVHEEDINAIAAVAVTRGCNPPDNDMFCPDRVVTRAEMASFMIRALAQYVP